MSDEETKVENEEETVETSEPVKKGGKKTASRPPAQAKKKNDDEMLDLLKGLAGGMESLSEQMGKIESRVKVIETGGSEKFKDAQREEDIESARQTRVSVDPTIQRIVDEMLGEDFGIDVKPLGDRPGFRLTLIVPQRLSDNVVDKRPVIDKATGQYKKNDAGDVVFEDYVPEDRRSRILTTADSYDVVKKHCELVRAYIVSYFQKTSKPLPEFKVK